MHITVSECCDAGTHVRRKQSNSSVAVSSSVVFPEVQLTSILIEEASRMAETTDRKANEEKE